MDSTAFSVPTLLTGRPAGGSRKVSKRNAPAANAAPGMSRRRLGRIALSAAAATLVSPLTANAAGQKRPTFVKDESGISYYDVEEGKAGTYPQNGDFVTVDYVRFITPLSAYC